MKVKIKKGMRKEASKINNSLIILIVTLSTIIIPLIFASDNIIDNNTNESRIKINLEYSKDSDYDVDNDGIESLEGIVDFDVGNTEIDESLNESNICTRWNVYSVENESSLTLCYGAEKCCNFIEMSSSSNEWDDIFYLFYGKYGATNNNKVSAQVIYVDYSLDEENLYSEIYYSRISSLNASFRRETEIKTRISSYFEKQEISKGEIQTFYSRLQYVNDSVISFMNISLYLNNDLFETKTTDDYGEAVFEVDTFNLSPGDYSAVVKFNGVKIQSWNETIVFMPSSNESVMRVLPSDNESIYLTENLTQGDAEIGKPVKWTKKITIENFADEIKEIDFSFKTPKESENIVVKKEDKLINEKKSGILSALLSLGQSKKEAYFQLGETIKDEKVFSIKDSINKTKSEYFVEYETPSPKKQEIYAANGNAIKKVKIYSESSVHYHNVKAYSDIPEKIENPRIYHLKDNSRIDVTDNPEYGVLFIDSNGNGLYDKVEWTVPMLSEQIFEIGVATVNTKKSIYHPGEKAEIIMVVLDNKGHLVSDAEVELTITNPLNETSYYSTSEQTITETEDGIYEASYSETNAEGNYSLFVSAVSDYADSTMNSYFTVMDYYEFDILRNIPATTDPWHEKVDSSVKIISYTNESYFDYNEVLPDSFMIIDGGNAAITHEDNKNVLRWQDMENNSVVNYSFLPPKETPKVWQVGPSYIDYDSQIFTEARPWYLAVDPVVTEYDPNSDVQTGFISDCTNHYDCVNDGVYSPSTPSTSGDRITANSNNENGYYEEWGFPSISQSNINSITAYVYLSTGSKNQFIIRLQQSGTTRASTSVT
ncbi:MAG: FixH family protein, partial [Candidatus Nanoarchaeia archaeon]|nr:FixH family protein [Candidatus Nanoarchaeia archaeon]